SLMCFHASRFDARLGQNGDIILYNDQDTALWNEELIARGEFYLNKAATGERLSKYHLEAGIAYWHTRKIDTAEKWENILQLYNKLLQFEYSSIAALNRTYALAKARDKAVAITEAEKLQLTGNHLYYSLLGYLYTDVDRQKALTYLKTGLKLAKSKSDKEMMMKHIKKLNANE
ncbi:MAG: RNA polymerase subunit sigma, partial [Bacteroidota bacterium]|nr:RNA polymerase subunit sigma [Bacteroidota bacterium]